MTQSLPDAAEQAAAAEKESALVRIIDDEIDVREALALMLRIEEGGRQKLIRTHEPFSLRMT